MMVVSVRRARARLRGIVPWVLAVVVVLGLGFNLGQVAFAAGSLVHEVHDNKVKVDEDTGTHHSDTYKLKLGSDPSASVTVTITWLPVDQITVSPTTLTFTTGNWMNFQTITVTAVDDSIVEGDHQATVTHTCASTDPDYNGVTSSLTVDIEDNDDILIITESDGDTLVAEAGPTFDTYTVSLRDDPKSGHPVTVNLTTPDGQTTVLPATLTFTHSDHAAKTVTVTAVDDHLVEASPHPGVIVHTTSCTEPGLNGKIAYLTAHITDNDVAAVLVSPTTLSLTEGASGPYAVSLLAGPTASVTITVAPAAGLTTDHGTLTFTTSNWATPQTVTVTATPDTVCTGTRTLAVTHAASGDNYGSVSVDSVVVSVADDDTAAVLVSPTTLSLTEGASGPYAVSLVAGPTASVTITVTPAAGLTTDKSALIFTTDDWAVPQTVTVTATPDTVCTGPRTLAVTHAASGDNYGSVSVASVVVSVADDDTAAVLVSPTTLSLTEGASGPYAVSLLAGPTAPVTITVTPAAGLTTDKSTLIFTSGNWGSAQTVTVTATPDTVYTGPRTLAVTHAASGDNYGSVSVASVVVSVADDELAPVVVEEEDDCCSPPSLRGPWLLSRDLVNHWSCEEATLALNLGIIPGNSKGLWVPSGLVTRAEFITWLNRAAGFPWENAQVTFKDVKPSAAFYRDVQTAVAVGTALGDPDGNFRPGEPITREEAGAMVAKALVHCGRSPVESDLMARLLLEAFRDGKDVSRVFLRDVALVVYHDIMLGHTPKTLAPKAELTRAEAAEMLVRFWRLIRMR